MPLRYAFLAAAALCVVGLAEAQAQSPFPPVGQQKASPFPPAGQEASPFPSPDTTTVFGVPGQQAAPAQSEQLPPCLKDFIPLREEVEKRFEVVKTTMAKKPTAAEACTILTRFTQAETALITFLDKNSSTCPFPPGLADNIKATHVKSDSFKKQACTAAAQQQQRVARPAQPTLSDAFGSPAPNAANTRSGGGTFDTLSGSPLGR